MNIVFVVSGLDSGGLENYLLRFLQYRANSFNKIYVLCKSGVGGQLEQDYIAIGNVEIIKLSIKKIDPAALKKIHELFINNKIDAVCDFTGNFAGRILKVAKKAGIEKRISFYRNSRNKFPETYDRLAYNWYCKQLVKKYATSILSNSKEAFAFFYDNNWSNDVRLKVIYNGLDATRFINEQNDLRDELSIPFDAFVVGHTGRFDSQKNHTTMLKAAQALTQKYDDIYFLMCGNRVADNLSGQVQGNKRILLFNNRSDIPAFLNTLDCYFFPSTIEGQPNALIEAMVMGLPFVASDIPPIRETVGDDYALYPAMNVDALASAIEKEYQERRGRDAELQQVMIKRFDYKERFDEFYKVLRHV